MSCECFLIHEVGEATEYVVSCSQKHRVVVWTMTGVAFASAPAEPPEGWPAVCSVCGELMVYDGEFEDGWRSKVGRRVYRRPGTGEVHLNQHEFGPGAMFYADGWGVERGPDGRSLGVVLPPGGPADVWLIDGPASSGGRWSRSGVPPKVTASPSILTGSYHGFLQDGVLTDSLPDRPL